MSKKITIDRWEEAQTEELKEHIISSYDINFYNNMYKNIFNYLNIFDFVSFKDKTIVEVGPAFYPALLEIETKKSIVVEPLFDKFDETIKLKWKNKNIVCYSTLLEQVTSEHIECDEIWIFNVMQHIMEPDLFLQKSIDCSKIIRIFEPINWPTNTAHPHSYSFEYFTNKFKNFEHNLSTYKGGEIPSFHMADCIHGSVIIGK
jgi:hypothetical protein